MPNKQMQINNLPKLYKILKMISDQTKIKIKKKLLSKKL